MKEKNRYGIVLDGRMDEPVWDTVESHTGFRDFTSGRQKGAERYWQTSFKILPCEDRIYIGIRCEEPDGMEKFRQLRYELNGFRAPTLEMFLCPSGSDFEIYQFAATVNGEKVAYYYSENGDIQPDRYAPDWDFQAYVGDEYWSMEVEIPLTAFYWTTNDRWSDEWLVNLARTRVVGEPGNAGNEYSTWSALDFLYLEPKKFTRMGGFPMRPVEDDLAIISATAEITGEDCGVYRGVMTVQTFNAVENTFLFSSNYAENKEVLLQAGSNEFTVPCSFQKNGRTSVELCLTRKSDGKDFKRYYPVLVMYEPIKLRMQLPEYRNNFYPGQDYSKVTGTVSSLKPVTLTLEGAGIPAKTITPNADGSFCFETPDFEIGEAWLTAAIDGYELKKKIRRLAPTGHTMAWISGGNLVIDGKPTLRRDMYAPYYRIGEAFKSIYDQDELHETHCKIGGDLEPWRLMPGVESFGGEATLDEKPSAEMLSKVDKIMDRAKDWDFVYYYLSDEPECRGLSSVYFRYLYEYIIDKDPYHLVNICSRSTAEFVEAADWFETHPYICPFNNPDGTRVYRRPLHTIGKYVDDIVMLNRSDKCIGFLPTCYGSGGVGGWDYPTFDEYILHTWAAMIHGGKSLWPYAGHDLNDRASILEGTRYIFSSFEALEDIILLGKRTTLTRSLEAEAVLYEYGDEKLFALVNYTQTPLTVTLDSLTGTWHEFRHDRMITGNTFHLKPLETVVGTSVVRDAGLPTYQEVAALVDKQEYERTHGGSLFFNRGGDLSFKHTKSMEFFVGKLFDGVRNNLAVARLEKGERFLEIDQTKVAAKIKKLVVYGFNLENTELKVGTAENLSVPAFEDVQTAEFSKTFVLKEAICPECLRLEYNTEEPVELYEIEAF